MITAKFIISVFCTSIAYEAVVCKNHNRPFNSRTYFEAFNDNILRFYHYTGNNTNFQSHYSFEEFVNLFYDAVCYDEELPKYVQEKFIIYFNCRKNADVDNELVYSALNEIRDCIVQSKLDETVKDFWIKDNERKTKKIRELIFRPHLECNSVALVYPLIEWAENHNRITYEFIYKIFEYGYITGKRTERARKNNMKVSPPTSDNSNL